MINTKTMKELKTEIILNAPKETVWNTLLHFEAYGDWNPFILSVKGEAKEGTYLTNTMINNGQKMVFKPIVTKVEEHRCFEWLGSAMGGAFKGRHYFILEDLGNAQTKLIHGEQFTGLLSSLILRMIGEATLGSFQKMNKALKERVEGN